MDPIAVDRFAEIVGGEAFGFAPGAVIRGFATDHRSVETGDLFLAIRGARVDGHAFAGEAAAGGAVGTVSERAVEGPYVLVENLVQALARLGGHFRSRFSGPVVGVTGSAGKTTTKEFVAAALSPMGEVLKTRGNRNTEYTAPLVWSELHADTRAAVVEMSMRGFGQIRHLASIAKPTIGVITNIGHSHLSEVGSRDGIARAKSELLESLPPEGVAVLWQEDPYLQTLKSWSPSRVVTFGFSEGADCRILRYQPKSWTSCRIEGRCADETFEAELPTVGRHVALGAAAGVAVARESGVDVARAASALSSAEVPHMRMEAREFRGATFLLDMYNAAPASMLGAIETFIELPCAGRRLAVIGEMRELGPYSEEAHRDLGRLLASSGIDEVVFYAGDTALSAEEARARGLAVWEAGTLEEVAEFLRRAREGDAVLVKGSRSLELERAVEMAHAAGAGC